MVKSPLFLTMVASIAFVCGVHSEDITVHEYKLNIGCLGKVPHKRDILSAKLRVDICQGERER